MKENNINFKYTDGNFGYFNNWKELIDFWAPHYGSKTYTENYFRRTAYGAAVTKNGTEIMAAPVSGPLTAKQKADLMSRAAEYVERFNKECIGVINDEDFGRVEVYHNRENNMITANALTIYDIPEDFKDEDITRAWNIFKAHYGEYSCVGVNYEQIADMENLYERY